MDNKPKDDKIVRLYHEVDGVAKELVNETTKRHPMTNDWAWAVVFSEYFKQFNDMPDLDVLDNLKNGEKLTCENHSWYVKHC